MKSACMADKKDTEKKEFNWKIISAASFVLMTAVGIGTAALGGKFDIKLLKKQQKLSCRFPYEQTSIPQMLLTDC